MKFVCLGYIEPGKFESLSETEAGKVQDRCFEYDDSLREKGHFAGGDALEGPEMAKTLRCKDGEIVVTDGPYAETREQIGGILYLEADNMDHAVQLLRKHPGVMMGPFEIRPAADLTAMIQSSEERRGKLTSSAHR